MLLARMIPALFTAALILISPPSYAEEADWPGFALIRNSTVQVGRNADYEMFLKELAAADKDADASTNRIIESGLITDGGLYTHISFHTDFTDLREPIGYLQVHGDDAWRDLVGGLDGVVQRCIESTQPCQCLVFLPLGRDDIVSGTVQLQIVPCALNCDRQAIQLILTQLQCAALARLFPRQAKSCAE